MSDTVRMVSPHGDVYDVTPDQVQEHIGAGFHVEGAAEHGQRLDKEYQASIYDGGVADTIAAGVQSALSAGTLGGYDAFGRLVGGDSYANYRKGLAEANPIADTVGGIVGGIATPIPIGKLADVVKPTTEGAGLVAQVGRAGARGAIEGSAYGFGSGVSDLALSDKPLDAEHIVSTLSSHMLYGAGIGGAAGSLGKVAEIGLTKARGAIDDAIGAYKAQSSVADDLASMDVKQLNAAAAAEKEMIQATHAAEMERVEASRVAERKSIADDITALRREAKDSELWATTKDLKMPASGEGRMSAAELGKMGAKADSQLARLSDNPIGLAANPAKAIDALQRQEHGLVSLLDHADDLRAAYAVDGLGGKRIAALEAAPALLEKNRALQARIAEVGKALPKAPETSARLEAIAGAKDALASVGKSGIAAFPQRMLEGSSYGAVHNVIASLPIPGAGMLAAPAAAMLSKVVGEKVFGRLSKTIGESVARTGQAVSKFLDTGARVTKAATPVATRVLANVRFAPETKPEPNTPTPRDTLARHFADRTQEIRSQVMPGPDGKAVMRPDARQALGDRLQPVAVTNPKLADMLETLIARRLTFLADKMPRRPDILGNQIGPDRWQPPDMEMRKFARYVAAVEDPGAIEERLASGTVSPEDAEVMREVYPERLREITQQIVAQLPQLRGQLPYERKLALSIMTDVPVVAAMDPAILHVLQGTFAAETPEDGKPPGPVAKAQFGSVSAKSAPEPTPAQSRSQ